MSVVQVKVPGEVYLNKCVAGIGRKFCPNFSFDRLGKPICLKGTGRRYRLEYMRRKGIVSLKDNCSGPPDFMKADPTA